MQRSAALTTAAGPTSTPAAAALASSSMSLRPLPARGSLQHCRSSSSSSCSLQQYGLGPPPLQQQQHPAASWVCPAALAAAACRDHHRRHRRGASVVARADAAGASSSSSSSSSSKSKGDASPSPPPLTFDEVAAVAASRGLHLSLKTLGPGYRVVCRDGGPDGPILGTTSGFVAPPPFGGLMHCDTLQIFTRGVRGERGDRVRGGPLGLGLLLGGAVFAHGRACGCKKAEILAINDDDAWHERLVRYYSFFGFKEVCRVGGRGLADVPHMLVWGGEGTRMDADVDAALRRWARAIRAAGVAAGPLPGAAAVVAAAAADGGGGAGGAGGSAAETTTTTTTTPATATAGKPV